MDNTRVRARRSRAADAFEKDRRRRRHHWAVTVVYQDGGEFQRVYTDEGKARKFAARQENSPVVRTTRVQLLS